VIDEKKNLVFVEHTLQILKKYGWIWLTRDVKCQISIVKKRINTTTKLTLIGVIFSIFDSCNSC